MHTMPKGTYSLYITQIFSTFSYAVLYSSLTLYISQQLHWSDIIANSIVGLFLACNYLMQLLGGSISGIFLSNRSLFFFALVAQLIGLLLLAKNGEIQFFLGLSFFLVGTGAGTVSYNNLLHQLFRSLDAHREKSFFYSYGAMNLGFFLGFVLSGFYDALNQYNTLFYIGVLCTIFSIAATILRWKYLSLNDVFYTTSVKDRRKRRVSGILSLSVFVLLVYFCFQFMHVSNSIFLLAGLTVLLLIVHFCKKQATASARQRLQLFLYLAIASIIFWMVYLTGPMGVTLFIKNNVNKQWGEYYIPTQWILNFNCIFIIISSPLLVSFFAKLRQRGFTVTVTTQFAWGFILLSCSFLLLGLAINYADNAGYIHMGWIILHFFLQALAELLVAPVGYAMIAKLIPSHLQGISMGIWLMMPGIAASLAHFFSNAMTVSTSFTISPLMTNSGYQLVFLQLAAFAFFGAIFIHGITRKQSFSFLVIDHSHIEEGCHQTAP